jgi:hypothetical protein
MAVQHTSFPQHALLSIYENLIFQDLTPGLLVLMDGEEPFIILRPNLSRRNKA